MVNAYNSASRLRKTIAYTSGVDPKDVLELLGIPYIPSDWTLRDLSLSSLPREPELAPGPWHETYVLVVRSLAEAREFLPLLTVEGVANNLVMAIQYWGDGLALDIAMTPPVAEGQSLKIFMSRGVHSYKFFQLQGSTWQNIHVFVSAIGGGHNATRRLPLSGVRLGVHDRDSALWTVGDGLARWADPDVDQALVPNVDSVDIHVERLGVTDSDPDDNNMAVLPPVDPVIFSPAGFDAFPKNGIAKIKAGATSPASWQIVLGGTEIGLAFPQLDENILAKVRSFRGVHIEAGDIKEYGNLSRMLTQLVVSGVPVSVSSLGQRAKDLLGREVCAALSSGVGESLEPSERESQSINRRRTVLKKFLPRLRFASLGIGGSRCGYEWPTVSIVLPTRRRDLIPRILRQIEQQSYSQIEVILAIHGDATLPQASQLAISSFAGSLVALNIDDSVPLGEVLNMASSAASGELIAKMDDDDWYSSMHIEDLVLAREYSGAELVGCPVEFSYLEGLDITTRRSHSGEKFTDHVAGGTMLLSKQDLKRVGSWRPTSSAVDRALIDATRASGARIYRTHGQNYVMHRRPKGHASQTHTWDADQSVFLRDIKEQWDGLVLPPQFGITPVGMSVFERSSEFLSVFSASRQTS